MKRLLTLVALASVCACNNQVTGLGPPSDPATETFDPALGITISQMTKLESGVYIQDLVLGNGDEVTERTDTVWVTFTGFLKNGEEFDSGVNSLLLPNGIVPGLALGMIGMRIGGRRMIVIPSELGYGEESITEPGTVAPLIPRQSTLVFRIELLRLHTPPEDDEANQDS
jgi:FKBP-type peptidyl-prolyl cis-trans isomerase FkpA